MTSRLPALLLCAALGSLLAPPSLLSAPVPDFSLTDMNATSPRNGEAVSPRDYRHQITAYYFGAAT